MAAGWQRQLAPRASRGRRASPIAELRISTTAGPIIRFLAHSSSTAVRGAADLIAALNETFVQPCADNLAERKVTVARARSSILVAVRCSEGAVQCAGAVPSIPRRARLVRALNPHRQCSALLMILRCVVPRRTAQLLAVDEKRARPDVCAAGFFGLRTWAAHHAASCPGPRPSALGPQRGAPAGSIPEGSAGEVDIHLGKVRRGRRRIETRARDRASAYAVARARSCGQGPVRGGGRAGRSCAQISRPLALRVRRRLRPTVESARRRVASSA